MKLHKLLILGVALVALFLAACGGGGAAEEESASENTTIDVLQNDIYYEDSPTNAEDPPVWTANAGGAIRVRLENAGTLEHNFAIVALDATVPEVYTDENADILIRETGLVAAGESKTETLEALDPGEYIVICTVAGHWPSMQGKLVVQ
ncbi:MAG: hypothetical protein AAF633_09655 [Chloroflexota bacterium]